MGSTVSLEILDPIGGVVTSGEIPFAPRLATIDNKTIGLVWNGKPSADLLLDFVEELLCERFPTLATKRYLTSGVANRLKPGELEGIANEVDAVIYASGD